MYNNQPPYQSSGGLPPFPPNRPPVTGYPPYPPQAGSFVRPPFPPSFTPPQTAGPMTPNPSIPMRPPPGGMPIRPAHPGLGLPPLPNGAPAPPVGYQPPGFVKEVKTTKLFVGGIPPGITDDTIRSLLNACGPLHELKRVTGANGKPQAFGFAMFENPEVVMRALRCLNGVELPDMSPEGRAQRKPPKALVVTVDDKTREFLDEFESTLGRTDADEAADAICRKSIAHLVALLLDPTARPPADLPNPPSASQGLNEPYVVPAHLQDLQEGDLPEEQRVAVLDQIAIFRETAARREREKKLMEEAKEKYKGAQERPPAPAGPSGYGYGNRGLQQDVQAKAQAEARQRERDNARGSGHSRSPSAQLRDQNGHGDRRTSRDSRERSKNPQGYSDPVNFVRPQHVEGKDTSERTDEEEEALRQRRRKQEADAAMRERERQVESRERHRIDRVNREMAQRRQHEDLLERNRRRLENLLSSWDDDERDDLFYTDRARWRAQRQTVRLREYQEDVRDRQLEEDERIALEKESEEFLKRQMEEMAAREEEQRKKGLLTEDAAPIRLALDQAAIPEPKKEEKPAPPVARRPAVFVEDEEDVDGGSGRKKQKTFVKLEYEGEADDTLTEAEQAAKRTARLLEIRNRLPHERRRLFGFEVEWAAMSEALLRNKIKQLVQDKMKHFLGEVDGDMVEYILENLRDRKGPQDVIEGIEPVFAEEAPPFVHDLWRQIIFESAAYVAGVDTGTMLV